MAGGWHPNTLLRAVYERLAADTGSGGLLYSSAPLVTGIYTRRFPTPSPASTDFPYVIAYFDAMSGDDTFSTEGKRVGLQVEWFVDETASGTDSVERAGKILERVVGDWTDQASGVPSYGLSRYAPTLQTGWSSTPILFESASDVSIGLGVIHWQAMFSVIVSKPGT